MKRVLLTVAALFLAATSWAQTVGNAVRVPLFSDMDFDTVGSYMYCVTTGAGDDALAPGRSVRLAVTTVGSSTTVTAVTTGSGPFQFLSVGDEITFPSLGTTPVGTDTPRGGESFRYVVTKTSADIIVVNAAIDLSVPTTGYPFTWRKRVCGTTSTSGWFSTSSWQDFDVTFQADQSDASTLDASLECENFGAASAPNQVWTKNYLLANYGFPGGRTTVAVHDHFDRCRLGVRLTDDASDAAANLEKISAYVRGRRPNP